MRRADDGSSAHARRRYTALRRCLRRKRLRAQDTDGRPPGRGGCREGDSVIPTRGAARASPRGKELCPLGPAPVGGVALAAAAAARTARAAAPGASRSNAILCVPTGKGALLPLRTLLC